MTIPAADRTPGRWSTGWRAGLVAVALGALAAAGQAPLGLGGVTLVALAGFGWWLACGQGARRGAGLAWAVGLGHFAASLFWIVEPFFVDPIRHGWLAPFALILLPGGLALFWAAAGAVAGAVGGSRGVLVWPVALGLAELARGHVLTGFPWAQAGHVWVDTPVAQLAAIIGASGLTAATLLLAALPVLGQVWRGQAGAVAGAALAGLVLVAGWGWGAARLAGPLPDGPGVQLRLVQPNAPQHLKWQRDLIPVWFERHLDLTAAPPAEGTPPPDLVIWSETAIPWLLEDAAIAFEMIAEAAQGATVALGLNRLEGWEPRNALAVIDAEGTVIAVYDKHHLVPFGEYIPFSDLIAGTPLGGLASRMLSGFTPGPGPVLLDLGPLGRPAPMICYETIFPRHLARLPDRPDWVLQVTNDAWFGAIAGPYQHLAQARLRAVEFGLPVVRAANTGVSAVIDARGQVVAGLALNTAGALDAALPGTLPPTPFARIGEGPLAVLLAALLALLLAPALRRRA